MTAVAAAHAITHRLARARQVDFWMRELSPAWSADTLRARVVDMKVETHDVTTFVLAPNHLWPGHRAGQFVSVGVEINGARVARCYSLSSAPGDERIAITVKRVPAGRVSSWMHDRVRRGDVLHLGMPAGDLVLPDETPAKLLLLSGGSGITPVMSILRDLARRNAIRDVAFVHAARSKEDVIFARELAHLALRHAGLRVEIFLDDDRSRGRLDATKLQTALPDLAERETLLCAPAGMMDALTPLWQAAGIRHRLKTERFSPAPRAKLPAGDGPAKLKLGLVSSERTIVGTGDQTLLEQLEQGGVRPATGCRMGICNTCSCKKHTGIVENIVTGELSTEPNEDIRLCVSRPRTDVDLAL